MHSFQDLLKRFEEVFVNHQFPQHPKSLYEPCSYLLHIGGKRIRPVLCLMTHEMFAEINSNAMNTAIAIELFHNFTLMHDDIMDEAPLRRGQQTVHNKYNLATAILSGDVMNIYSYVHLNKIDTNFIHVVLEQFNKTAIEICEGQQLDMDFEREQFVSMKDYMNMITLKTSVLLGASVQLGAILGGASDGCSKLLYQYGKHLGLAFQLMDDYLDSYGNSEATGKEVGGDIRSNKKTYLLSKAFELGKEAETNELLELLKRNDEAKVNDVLLFLSRFNIQERLQEEIKQYSKLAFHLLEDAPILSKRKKPLFDLTESLLNRKS